MTGQDAVNAAQAFDEALGIDGTILTKLDGDTRGRRGPLGARGHRQAHQVCRHGEKLEDLEVFYPDRMASRILGMGDVLTLIEKAQTTVDEKKALEMAKKLKQNSFDMNDLLDQMQQIKSMGPLSQVLGMLPGLSGKIGDAEAAQARPN